MRWSLRRLTVLRSPHSRSDTLSPQVSVPSGEPRVRAWCRCSGPLCAHNLCSLSLCVRVCVSSNGEGLVGRRFLCCVPRGLRKRHEGENGDAQRRSPFRRSEPRCVVVRACCCENDPFRRFRRTRMSFTISLRLKGREFRESAPHAIFIASRALGCALSAVCATPALSRGSRPASSEEPSKFRALCEIGARPGFATEVGPLGRPPGRTTADFLCPGRRRTLSCGPRPSGASRLARRLARSKPVVPLIS